MYMYCINAASMGLVFAQLDIDQGMLVVSVSRTGMGVDICICISSEMRIPRIRYSIRMWILRLILDTCMWVLMLSPEFQDEGPRAHYSEMIDRRGN